MDKAGNLRRYRQLEHSLAVVCLFRFCSPAHRYDRHANAMLTGADTRHSEKDVMLQGERNLKLHRGRDALLQDALRSAMSIPDMLDASLAEKVHA
jgi:hypothetical protein